MNVNFVKHTINVKEEDNEVEMEICHKMWNDYEGEQSSTCRNEQTKLVLSKMQKK